MLIGDRLQHLLHILASRSLLSATDATYLPEDHTFLAETKAELHSEDNNISIVTICSLLPVC